MVGCVPIENSIRSAARFFARRCGLERHRLVYHPFKAAAVVLATRIREKPRLWGSAHRAQRQLIGGTM
jgi:hypothetical protein